MTLGSATVVEPSKVTLTTGGIAGASIEGGDVSTPRTPGCKVAMNAAVGRTSLRARPPLRTSSM